MLRILALLCILVPVLTAAQIDQSLSPYFIVNVDSGESVPDFPLQLTSAEVEIAGVIADVTITQVYTNHSSRPLEAVYVFPGSTNAAVYAMEMQIGRRTIVAEIREKHQARHEYTEAKEAGKTASLLEQQRPNIFTMNVANVMPGDSIIVRMSYTERLIPTNGVHEFVYPTVVGPRYTGAGAPDSTAGNNAGILSPADGIPYTEKGTAPLYDFNINVNVSSCLPFEFIRSTSHKVLLSFEEKNNAKILLDPTEKNGGNRDFILQYRFAGGKIETGLMLYEGKDENFFMLMMQPPKRIPLDSIPPREYIFVMDVSGSMSGYPLETSKQLMRNLVSGLRPTDKFNIIQFAGGGAMLSDNSMYATTENLDSAITFINTVRAGGGTELNNAMRMAMFIPKQEGYSRSIVIVTDGLISAESKVLKSMRNHLDSANVFAFGIGSSVNRYLIEAMAYCGNGEPFVVAKSNEADSAAERFRRYIASPVLTNIRITYNGFDAYDAEPEAVPDLFAERPLVITGKYHGKPGGKIIVTGLTGTKEYRKEIAVDSVKPHKQNKAIRLLWARDRVKYLSYLDNPANPSYGYAVSDTTVRGEITTLGLKYGLLTNYTSFIAVDRKIRNKNAANDSTVTEPLPLPAGVENSAIGMNGALREVLILGYASTVQVDPSFCDVKSISCCVIMPSRASYPEHACSSQDPVMVGDINRFYFGSFYNPVVTNNAHPLFTSGASGRIISSVPMEMLGSYSIYPSTYTPGLYSPVQSSSVAFNTWLPNNRVTLSGTHYGMQNLYFGHQWSPANKWQSKLELDEQWKGTNTDRNKDGYIDDRNGAAVSLHHRISYYSDASQKFRLSDFSNGLFFHTSSFSAGQVSGNYAVNNNAIGFYDEPALRFRTKKDNDIYIAPSIALAKIDDGWGADRFHLKTLRVALEADYHFNKGNYEYQFGMTGSVSSGYERWNNVAFDPSYQMMAVHAAFDWYKNGWSIYSSLRGEYSDINGGVILPAFSVLHSFDKFGFSASGTRYRSEPFATGQLSPLFYSSRNLNVTGIPSASQGWNFNASVNYVIAELATWRINATYSIIIPERIVIVDLDSDADMINVDAVNNNSLYHRVIAKFELFFPGEFSMKGEYVFNFIPQKHEGNSVQQALTPVNRAYCQLRWRDTRNRFFLNAEIAYTGKQRLPQHGWSSDYVTIGLLSKYKFRSDRYEIFANALNLLDYRQKNLLYGSIDGSDHVEGWMVWAPITGRTFQVGVTMKF